MLFVILAVAVVRSSILTNSNAANKTAGGYQDYLTIRAERAQYSTAVKADCVAGWALDEGTGTSTLNAKGHVADNGTLINGPTWTSGKRGNAILFDGTNDYVNISQSQTFNVTQFTITAWVNTRSTSDYQHVFENGASSLGSGYTQRIESDAGGGTPTCITGNATGSTIQIAYGTFNFTTHQNEWHHLACTFDGTTTRLYVDGALNASANSPVITMATPAYTSVIGRYASAAAYHFNGTLDEVAVYNRSLADYEIAQLYAAKEFWCV